MKRHCKLIISTITVALIFTLCFSPCSYALSKQQFGAWIASALTALNIVTSSTLGPYADFVDDYLSDPFVKNEQSGAMDYIPYTWEDTDDFMDRTVIKIDKDVVTIDGVNYTNVWLSTDAAEKFRTNAFDLVTAFDIASQSEGTFVSGEGYIGNIPVFGVDGTIKSQNYVFSEDGGVLSGPVLMTVGDSSIPSQPYAISYTPEWSGNTTSYTRNYIPAVNEYVKWGTRYRFQSGDGRNWLYTQYIPDNYINMTPFDFDWVSGEVPVDQPLSDEGLNIRVPTQEIQQWYQDNPDIGPNVTINMGDPELENKIDDLIDLIIPLIPVLDIDFVDYVNPQPEPIPEPIPEPEPYPDPDPQPGTVIPDLDWSELFQTIKNIFNKISEHVSISTAIKNILDKIKWFLDDFFGDLGDILNNLPDIFERHVIDTIRRGLTGLKNIFLPILALLRNALGIWHYVVEWFQAISTPFSFYLNLLGQGYPLITVPIYAAIAGVIVIAVYRRFGR